jgi:hypothetical protein
LFKRPKLKLWTPWAVGILSTAVFVQTSKAEALDSMGWMQIAVGLKPTFVVGSGFLRDDFMVKRLLEIN